MSALGALVHWLAISRLALLVFHGILGILRFAQNDKGKDELGS
jgi:hypothetical protein